MATIRMTKRFVADVLRKEPLSQLAVGVFVETTVPNALIRDGECASCAVGTVIKRALADSTTATQASRVATRMQATQEGVGWIGGDVLACDSPWRALSKVYEQTAKDTDSRQKGRRAAIRYVDKHFPSHVYLDINGYKARKARGVTVVKSKRR